MDHHSMQWNTVKTTPSQREDFIVDHLEGKYTKNDFEH